MQVGHESNEVADSRVQHAQPGRRISLRMQRIRKIANRFQTDHGVDSVPAAFAAARINKTSHLSAEEIWRLFVHKCDKAQCVLCRFSGEAAR